MIWTFEKIQRRSTCYKGGGSNEIPETEAQRANAEIALKHYNDYKQYVEPFEKKAIAGMTSNWDAREGQTAGMVNADLQQKIGMPAVDPVRGLAPDTSRVGKIMAGAQVKGRMAAGDAKAGAFQSVLDIGQGKAAAAQSGMATLAAQSVDEAAKSAASAQAADNARMSSGMTGLGMAAGLVKNMYDDQQTKKKGG